jgi:probable phosphoglycerate mutase
VTTTRLILIRHGAHDLLGRRIVGRMPGVSLNAAGRHEAAQAAAALARADIGALYASPLERARETAAPLAARLGLDLRTDDGLAEIDYGDWTGQDFARLADDPLWRMWNARRGAAKPPGGEAMPAVQRRMTEALARFATAHPGATVAAVGHGDPIKAAVACVLGLPLDCLLRFEIDTGSLTTIAIEPGGTPALHGRVIRLNERPAP